MFSCHLSLISSASVRSLPFLSFILTVFAWRYPLISPIFLKIFSLSNLHCVYLFISISIYLLAFISIFHLRRLSYLSLLFSGTLLSVGYIFPFLLCLLFLFFSRVFVRPPQTTTLPSCISFSWGWFQSLPPVQCTFVHSSSGTLSTKSIPLNLFVTSTV